MNRLKPLTKPSWITLYLRSIAGGLLCLIVLTIILVGMADDYQGSLIRSEKERINKQLPTLGLSLSEQFYDYYSILQELTSLVVTYPGEIVNPDELSTFANLHAPLVPGIHGFLIAPEGIIKVAYPEMKGVIGKALLLPRHSGSKEDEFHSAELFRVSVFSQSTEVDGAPLLVISQVVDPNAVSPQYIGLVLDMEVMAESMDLSQFDQELRLAIRDSDGFGLYGDPSIFTQDPTINTLHMPGSTWEIGAIPSDGWVNEIREEIIIYWVSGSVMVLSMSILAYLVILRRVRFNRLVARHTHELEEEIWQRKRVEQALLANEARFRLIYENLPIGYHSLNVRGELIDVNRAWLDMLGYSRMEVIGSAFKDYLSPQSKIVYEEFFTNYKESGQASNVEFILTRKDGSNLTIILDGRIGYDEEGCFRQTHCILRDVTQSKQAEQALRESEERYSSLFQDNQSVMLLVDPKTGEIVDANPAACSFYGYSLEEIKHKNISDINILPPEQVLAGMRGSSSRRERHFEFRHRLENGEIRDVEVYSGPITLQGRRLLYSIVHDISKRKKAEEALTASKEELRRDRDLISRIMETSPVSIFMVNHEGQVTFANAHAIQTFSLEKCGPNDSTYKPPAFKVVDINRLPVPGENLPFYQIIHDSGPIYGNLYALEWTSGEVVYLSISGAPIFDETGKEDAAIIIAEDVTENVYAERALRESEERFRSAFEYATVGMALTEIDGRFIMVNQALCDMLGYDDEELVGMYYTDLTHSDDIAANVEFFQKTLVGECRSFALEKRYFHKTGRVVWVDLDSFLLRDPEGKPLYFITHMQDITRGKEAEEALKASEQRYRLLFERNPQAMWVHDEQTLQFLAANEAMERQYGYTREELLQMTITAIRPPEEIEHLLDLTKNKTEGYSSSGVWKHKKKNGMLLDVETSSYTIDFGGKPARLVLAVDITERLRVERDSRQHAQELELLSEVSSVLRQAQTREAMVSVVMKKAKEVVQADAGALFMFDREGVVLAAEMGFSQPLKFSSRSFGDRLFRFSRDASAIFISNIVDSQEYQKSAVFRELSNENKQCVLVPLKTAEAVIGLVFLGWRSVYDFRSDEQRLLVAIAEIAGNALHRSGMMELLEQRVSDRTRELSALYALSAVASESIDFNIVIEQSLKRLLDAMPDKAGAIHLYNDNETEQSLSLVTHQGLPENIRKELLQITVGDGLVGNVLVNGEPLLIADLDESGELSGWDGSTRPVSYLGIPMRSHGKTAGVLSVFNQDGHPFNLEDIALLASGADQIGVTVENLRLRQQAEQVAIVRERERLARELHDSVTQSLYSLTLFSEVGQRMIHADDTSQLDHILGRLSETSLQALKEMRLLVYELRPSALEKDGLIGAIQKRLEAVEKRAGIQTHLDADDTLVFPFPVEEALYGITLEALNNSLKHSRADTVTVQIHRENDQVVLKVVDNGKGFDPSSIGNHGGLGLVSLRERTDRLGGELKIETLPGKGTQVCVTINYKRVSG